MRFRTEADHGGKKIIPAVRVDADVRLLLNNCEIDEFCLIRKTELLQDDDHLYSRSVIDFLQVNINSVPSMDWGRSDVSKGGWALDQTY